MSNRGEAAEVASKLLKLIEGTGKPFEEFAADVGIPEWMLRRQFDRPDEYLTYFTVLEVAGALHADFKQLVGAA